MAPPPDRSPLQAHPDVPTTLLYAAHDEFFDPDAERAYASSRGMLAQELATGHFPMLEDPSTLADVLIRCASS
jgi:pimeloyl-ACP methyl ester carboxylesterase